MTRSELFRYFKTLDEARAAYVYDLFNPAAVFLTPDGDFALGYLREQNWPPDATARDTEAKFGLKMVACCDPLMGIWHDYPVERRKAQP